MKHEYFFNLGKRVRELKNGECVLEAFAVKFENKYLNCAGFNQQHFEQASCHIFSWERSNKYLRKGYEVERSNRHRRNLSGK